MITPQNGLYITSQDFLQWQDFMENLLGEENTCSTKMKTKSITFVVTEACNLNCTYCYEKHKTNRKMTKDVAKQAVDFMLNDSLVNGYYTKEESPCLTLEFIGGEPLLEIDLIDYIVDYFKVKAFELNHPWGVNYLVNITSNGVLYNSDKVQRFLNKNKGKVNVGMTIDGNKELHDKCRVFHDGSGSYDIVEQAAKTWIKNQHQVQTKITLCPENVMYLNDAIKNVWDIGVTGAHTNCVFEPGWTLKDARILYDEMIKLGDYLLENKNYAKYYCSLYDEAIGTKLVNTRNWCGGNGDMLAIAPDGRCYPCIRFMNYSLTNPNVTEQPIGDIWRGLDKKEENPWLLKLCGIDMITQCQHDDNKKCLTCPIAAGCSLCTGFNYDHFGDPNHKATYICDTHKARVLANVYYWNKLYKQLNLNERFECNVPKEWALEIISEEEYNNLLELAK
jgi:uncharacterized protein